MGNIIDIILLVLLFLFALRGYFKGLFRESFSLLGLFIGFMVAVSYVNPIIVLFGSYWKFSPIILKAIVFVLLLFLVYFVFNLAGWLLHRSAKLLFLQGANRAGGSVLGLGKGAAILALILFLGSSGSWIPQKARQSMDGSYLIPLFNQLGQRLIEFGKSNLFPQEKSRTTRGRG